MPVLQATTVLATSCVLVCTLVILAGAQSSANRYLREPSSVKRVRLGSNVVFYWRFEFGTGQRNLFEEIQWGQFDSNGYMLDKYISVLEDFLSYKNPSVAQSIQDRLSVLAKNISSREMNIKFQIEKVNRNDASITYGSKVLIWGDEYKSGPISLIGVPSITIYKSSMNVVSGDQVYLHCNADGYPQPYVAWIKNGVVLQNSSTNYFYHIASITTSQAGIYTCRATNEGGSVAHALNVTVST